MATAALGEQCARHSACRRGTGGQRSGGLPIAGDLLSRPRKEGGWFDSYVPACMDSHEHERSTGDILTCPQDTFHIFLAVTCLIYEVDGIKKKKSMCVSLAVMCYYSDKKVNGSG